MSSRVLALVLPEFATDAHRAIIEAGMTSRGRDDFVGSPRRAAWIRPFSWQRTGYRTLDGVILLRRGVVWRSLAIVPLARLQSLELEQGPLDRAPRPRRDALAHGLRSGAPAARRDRRATRASCCSTTVAARAIASAESDRSHAGARPVRAPAPTVAGPTPAPRRPPLPSA